MQGDGDDGNDGKPTPIPVEPAVSLMPNLCGWLLKRRKPGGIKSTLGGPQRRWCCIKGGIFYYYLSDLSSKQQGSFYLHGYVAERFSIKKSLEVSLWFRIVKPGARLYEFQALDELALKEWIDGIAKGASIAPCLGPLPDGTRRNMRSQTVPKLPATLSLNRDRRYGGAHLSSKESAHCDLNYEDVAAPPSIPRRPPPLSNVSTMPMPAMSLAPTAQARFPKRRLPDLPTDNGICEDEDSDDSYDDTVLDIHLAKANSSHSVDNGFNSQVSGRSCANVERNTSQMTYVNTRLPPPIVQRTTQPNHVQLHARPQQHAQRSQQLPRQYPPRQTPQLPPKQMRQWPPKQTQQTPQLPRQQTPQWSQRQTQQQTTEQPPYTQNMASMMDQLKNKLIQPPV